MATATSPHKLRIRATTTENHTAPNNDNLLHDLTAALEGGDAVYDFFSGNVEALNNLYETIAMTGESAWIDGTDEKSGTPVTYVANGQHFLTVGAQIHDKDTLHSGTGDTDTYKQVGTTYVTLTTDQGTSQLIVNTIEYAGEGIAGILAAPAIFKLLKPIVKAVGRFLKNLCTKIYNKIKGGETTEDPDDAESSVEESSSEAGEEAGEAGAEIGDGIFADLSFSIGETVGVVVAIGIIAVVLILNLLEKQMTNWGKFFNATSIDVEFGICWMKSSAGAKIAPADIGDTIKVPKISAPVTPPWVTSSDTAIYRSDTQFVNTNELKGIGYVLQAKPSGDFPGFRVMVDIPNVGNNSLYIALDTADCKSVWDTQKDQNTGLTMKATSGKYTLRIATNKNSGKSPSPIDATEGYNYEHLLVLTDGTVNI